MKTIYDKEYRLLVQRLKKTRTDSGFTQSQLAEKLQIDQSYVSKYERCERRLDVMEIRDICGALRVDFVDFLSQLDEDLKRKGY